MSFTKLSPAWRTRLSRLVLILAIGATIATSPAEWRSQDTDSVPLPATIPAGGLVVQAAVHYRAPRGAWPIRVFAEMTPFLRRGVSLKQDVVFDDDAVRTNARDPEIFELRCREKECEGILDVDLVLTVPGAGQGPFTDPEMAASSLQLTAGVSGEPEGGIVSCQRQQSSTDRNDAPSKLLFDVVIDPIDSSLYGDAGVPDAGARGSSALPPFRGLDAGLE